MIFYDMTSLFRSENHFIEIFLFYHVSSNISNSIIQFAQNNESV